MLLRITALVLLAVPLWAGQVTYVNQLPHQPVIGPSWTLNTYPVNIPKFDPHLGRLTGLSVDARLDVQGSVSIENTGSSATSTGFYVGGAGYAVLAGNWTLQAGGQFFDHVFSNGTLMPFDGTIDHAGPSGTIVTFPQPDFSSMSAALWLTTQPSPGFPVDPLLLDAVTGMGTIPVVINAHPNIQPQWDVGTGLWSFTMDASPRVEITYYYDDHPARFCTGDLPGACPCVPAVIPAGGCPSSVNAAGASLAGSGASSVGADNFTLVASGLPMTTSVLFFQGTTATNTGTWFGDGRRCVGGQVTRLGMKQAVNGVATSPAAGDAPISVLANIPIGALRSYQAWYRNADPTFCTSATFNLTSAVVTVWTP